MATKKAKPDAACSTKDSVSQRAKGPERSASDKKTRPTKSAPLSAPRAKAAPAPCAEGGVTPSRLKVQKSNLKAWKKVPDHRRKRACPGMGGLKTLADAPTRMEQELLALISLMECRMDLLFDEIHELEQKFEGSMQWISEFSRSLNHILRSIQEVGNKTSIDVTTFMAHLEMISPIPEEVLQKVIHANVHLLPNFQVDSSRVGEIKAQGRNEVSIPMPAQNSHEEGGLYNEKLAQLTSAILAEDNRSFPDDTVPHFVEIEEESLLFVPLCSKKPH